MGSQDWQPFFERFARLAEQVRPSLARSAAALAPAQLLAEQARRSQAQLAAAVAPVHEAMYAIVQQLAGFGEFSRQTVESLRPALASLQRALPDIRTLQRLYDAWDARQRRAAAILAKKGWWLAPDFPVILLNKVIELDESRERRRINRLICNYYSHGRYRRLSDMVNRWSASPVFRRRRHLFDNALWAHKKRRWTLSIPVLLAQVEGVLLDYASESGITKSRDVKEIGRKLHLNSDAGEIAAQTWLTQLKQIFSGPEEKTTMRRHPGLKRNAVLHGKELRYGSEVKSLQLFMQLDTIYWLTTEKAKEKAA